MSMYIRACRIPVFQAGKDELPNANFQLGTYFVIIEMECKSGYHEREKIFNHQSLATLD